MNKDWPDVWKQCFAYDLMEVYGETDADPAYASRYRSRQSETIKTVTSLVKPGATVLDVAAAQGNFTIVMAEAGYRVTWNDLREGLVEYVRAKADGQMIEFLPGDAFKVASGREFDLVLATEIIEHVAHPDRFLERLGHLAKPGGYVVITTPNGRYLRNTLPKFSECSDPSQYESVQFKPNADGHIFLLYPEEIVKLADRAGLRVVWTKLITDFLQAGFCGTGILHQKQALRSLVSIGSGVLKLLPGPVKSRCMTGMVAVLQRPTA